MKTVQTALLDFQKSFDFTEPASVTHQQRILAAYKVLLFDKIGAFQEALLLADSDQYERFITRAQALSVDELLEFGAIPEVSHRLLHLVPGNGHPAASNLTEGLGGGPALSTPARQQMAGMLTEALDAEASKRTHQYDTALYPQLWAADGSFYCRYQEQTQSYATLEAYRLLDTVPVDFFSPYALRISNADVNEPLENTIAAYDFGEIEALCYWFDAAVAPLADYLPIAHQVSSFLRAIVVNKISHAGRVTNFISGSDARYIGRTVLSNVQGVSPELLVEAFVHESIHATLYMADACSPWLPTREQTRLAGYRAVSPWTGNRISISSIQEAIFVWYGVYKLWLVALERGLYTEQRVMSRLAFVSRGFRALNLSQIATACEFRVSAELQDVVEVMKQDVARQLKVQ
ncbi:hypothetical protein [Hymenobacter baengnokdamensis]|uniref:hypothetical protein n=1 Tax=Hymenobacter baengnokdamensis TaxID=2615203 RepID=UPI00124764B4|nr:hypothetical protein [Hymenobacter baengnokdamensis]